MCDSDVEVNKLVVTGAVNMLVVTTAVNMPVVLQLLIFWWLLQL